jgi:methionyl-tRNA formyltransferase
MITFLGNGKNNDVYGDVIWRHRGDRDVIVSCQYPYLIPPSIVRCGIPVVNIHYGILPYYRGVAPIYHQMMNGSEAGVTLHWVDEKFDTGDIIDVYSFPHHGHTADEVYKECEKRGVWLLEQWIDKIIDGTAPRNKQGDGTYYKGGIVDWNREKFIGSPFFDPEQIRRIFATHFNGKQYPEIEVAGRRFEMRAK